MIDQLHEDLAILAQYRVTINFSQSTLDEVQCSIDTMGSKAWTVAIAPDAFSALCQAARWRVSTLHLNRRELPLTRQERLSKARSKDKNTADLLASLSL